MRNLVVLWLRLGPRVLGILAVLACAGLAAPSAGLAASLLLVASPAALVGLAVVAHELVADVVDRRADVLLHLLLLSRLALSGQIHLADPELYVDRLVAERPSLVELADRVLAAFHCLVEHVGVVEALVGFDFDLDGNNGAKGLEEGDQLLLSRGGGDELDEQVGREILVDALVDGCLRFVGSQVVLAFGHVVTHKQVKPFCGLLLVQLLYRQDGGLRVFEAHEAAVGQRVV